MSRSIGRVANVLCAAALSMALPVAFAKDGPPVGAKLVHRDSGGRDWCVTVVATDRGVDAQDWVWFTFDEDPRRIEHAPVEALGSSCKAPLK
ncbi:MAG: hypothetical protein JF606_01775 [Burkholderiales bacterium]|jgi:hypothetical protein|nr:hypothetical protein [Burkholderiales bacterium]